MLEDSTQTIGSRIRALREKRGWTQKDLAAQIGVERATVASWETDRRVPETAHLKILAVGVDTSVDYLLFGVPEDASQYIQRVGRMERSRADGRLPILGRIRAGIPLLSEQNVIGHIEAPAHILRRAEFALEVSGDSMIGAGIQPGDIVFLGTVERKPPVHGNIVAAMVDQGDMTLKRYVKRNGSFWLVAENPKYAPIRADERVTIQGVYVARYTEHEGAVDPPIEDMTEDELITKLAQLKGLDPDAVRHLLEAAKAIKPRQ